MNNEQILEYMDTLVQQIPIFLRDANCLKHHLRYMRYFPDTEWFNIASILYNMPLAKNVKSKDAWCKILKKELFPKKGAKGLITLIPLYKDTTIKWKVVKVFDVSQMATSITLIYASPFKEIVDRLGTSQIRKHLGNHWQEIFLDQAFTTNHFYMEHENLRPFIENCIFYCFGDLLNITDISDEIDLSYPESNSDLNIQIDVLCYKAIKDIIHSLPSVFEKFHTEIVVKEQQIIEIQEAVRMNKLTIRERILRAMKISNDRLQTKIEGYMDNNTGQITNTTIILPEPIEDMIYQGEADL